MSVRNWKLPSDSEHCCAASFTDGFSCFLSVLHCYGLSVLAFFLCSALNTVHCHYLIHLLSKTDWKNIEIHTLRMQRMNKLVYILIQAKYIASSRHRMKLTVIKLLIILRLVFELDPPFANISALSTSFEPVSFTLEPIFICLLT